MTKYQIGIIGYGDFTKVLIELLAPHADIYVSSRSERPAVDGATFAPLAEILQKDIIIPSIPAQFYETALSGCIDSINPDSLWIDVASVKVRPLETLERLLPATCQIIGTHPMFGPASIARNGSAKGLRCAFVSAKASAQTVEIVRQFIADTLELNVIDVTADEHDRMMAYVQGLSHFIGRVMDEMAIPETPLATLAYEDLLDMKRIQGSDSWELFSSIMLENPYAGEVQQQFFAACNDVAGRIDDEKQTR